VEPGRGAYSDGVLGQDGAGVGCGDGQGTCPPRRPRRRGLERGMEPGRGAHRDGLGRENRAGSVTTIAISPDGRRIVTGSDDNTARVWDARTGTNLAGHTSSIEGVVVSSDGARIVTGSEDKTARVWDINTGAEKIQLKGHTGTVLTWR